MQQCSKVAISRMDERILILHQKGLVARDISEELGISNEYVRMVIEGEVEWLT